MLRLDVGRIAVADKAKPVFHGPCGRSCLLNSSVRGRLTHAPFSGARRVEVRANAAAGGTERRQPKAPRTVTVQLENLKPGQELDGKVVSIEAYGCFVDIGAKTDGLVHISQLGSGFVKSVQDIVSVGQMVKVKVMSVDTAKDRVALTMKGTASAPKDSVDDEDDAGSEEKPIDLEEDIEDEQADGEEEQADVDEDDDFEVPEGQIVIFPDELPEAAFLTPEDDDNEITADDLTDYEANEDKYEYEFKFGDDAVPLPLYEIVSGKVTRVESYGAFVRFSAPSGKQLEGMLHVSEMKAPAVVLSEADLEAYEPQDEDEEDDGLFDDYAHSQYVDVGDIEDATQYYQVGDEVTCFYIGQTSPEDGGRASINLSQFTDAELLGASIEVSTPDEEEEVLDDGEFQVDEGMADDFEDDALAAVDPVRILDEDDEAEPTAAELAAAITGDGGRFRDDADGGEEDTPANEEELATSAATYQNANVLVGNQLLLKDPRFVAGQLPSRPVRRGAAALDMPDLTSLELKEQDFEMDISDLQDYWTSVLTGPVPKDAMRKAGYKLQIAADGTVEEVKRDEEAAPDALQDFTLAGDSMERAKEFLADLMDDDVDEAEIPALAYRRPHVKAAAVTEGISAAVVKSLRQKTGAGMMDCKKALTECKGDVEQAIEWLRKKGLAGADKKAGRIAAEGVVASYIHPGSRLGVLLEVNCETDFVAAGEAFQRLVSEIGMVAASSPDITVVLPEEVSEEMLAKEREVEMTREDLKSKPEAVRAKIVEGRLDKIKNSLALVNQPSLRDASKTVTDIIKETVASLGENVKVRRFARFKLGEGLEKRSTDFAAEVAQQTQAKADKPKPAPAPAAPSPVPETKAAPTVQVSAAAVKELRQSTGAGMMDCKKALAESSGDAVAATEWLRKKGLAGADKKASRLAAEGGIAAYIHPGSRLGVLLEVNCETDFVAASDKFLQLVNSIAMQIAASPQVQYVSAEDIPADFLERERQVEMGRDDLKDKPDAMRAKIAEGRAKKIVQEMALLEQPYLMDQSKTVSEAVKEAIAAIGEKISIRRFVRYQLGEGLEKRSTDFAAEVAAATGQKA